MSSTSEYSQILGDDWFETYLYQHLDGNLNKFFSEIEQQPRSVFPQVFVAFYKFCLKYKMTDHWTRFNSTLAKKSSTKSFDEILNALIAVGHSYSEALKIILGTIVSFNVTPIDFIARKIASVHNDKMSEFIDELKQITRQNYRFNPLMVNAMMRHCLQNYNHHFHDFIAQQVLKHVQANDLHQDVLNDFNRQRPRLLQRRGLLRSRTIKQRN